MACHYRSVALCLEVLEDRLSLLVTTRAVPDGKSQSCVAGRCWTREPKSAAAASEPDVRGVHSGRIYDFPIGPTHVTCAILATRSKLAWNVQHRCPNRPDLARGPRISRAAGTPGATCQVRLYSFSSSR